MRWSTVLWVVWCVVAGVVLCDTGIATVTQNDGNITVVRPETMSDILDELSFISERVAGSSLPPGLSWLLGHETIGVTSVEHGQTLGIVLTTEDGVVTDVTPLTNQTPSITLAFQSGAFHTLMTADDQLNTFQSLLSQKKIDIKATGFTSTVKAWCARTALRIGMFLQRG